MLIRNIAEPAELFSAVNACKGRVELVTDEGDRLNLRSTLCQYIALTQMFQDRRVDGIELVLSEPEDFEKLRPYLDFHE
ncbi:MAG: polya polymerase [Eubacteriales bacterium]|nr:polya polymerase [Eubacteriales bacterium]